MLVVERKLGPTICGRYSLISQKSYRRAVSAVRSTWPARAGSRRFPRQPLVPQTDVNAGPIRAPRITLPPIPGTRPGSAFTWTRSGDDLARRAERRTHKLLFSRPQF